LNTDASIAFYESMGLEKQPGSHNHGPAQNALDGLYHAQVTVTPLMPLQSAPHLELLCYRGVAPAPAPMAYNDVACTKTVFEAPHGAPTALIDPDGHHVMMLPTSQTSFFEYPQPGV
jgi:hypothetical protein